MILRKEQGLYLLLCLGVFVYIILRAINVPLIHDEVATYIHYVHQGEFIPGHALVDANNHVVNSIFSIASDRLFGTSILSLRLSNVLCFLVFALYLFLLSTRIKDRFVRWGFIVSLLGSHYLIEFFALSRGYGISIAALLGLIWHLGEYFEKHCTRDGLLLSFWMIIGLGSNLSLLYVVLFSISIVLLDKWYNRATKPIVLLPMVLLAIMAVVYSLKLKGTGALYYGQGSGFWEVTMQTLSLYLSGDDRVFPFIFLGSALLSVVVLVPRARSISILIQRPWIYHILLLASLAGIFLAHFLFDTNYPEDRVGLYLYPLLIGAFCASLMILKESWPLIRYLALILFYFPLHFMLNSNLDHVDFSFRERVPTEFYDILEQANEESDANVTLSGYHTTALTYFMGAHLAGQEVPPMMHYDFPSETADYILLRGSHGKTFNMQGLELLATDPPSGNTLWKRRKMREKTLVQQFNRDNLTIVKDEFYELFHLTLPGYKDYAVRFEISYTTQDSPADINLILSNKNADGEDVNYTSHSLGWRQDQIEMSDKGSLYINGSGGQEDEVIFYLWNIDKTKIQNIEYTVSLYHLE